MLRSPREAKEGIWFQVLDLEVEIFAFSGVAANFSEVYFEDLEKAFWDFRI